MLTRFRFIDKIADKVRWGYLTAFILLLVSYMLTFYSSQEVLNQQVRVNHTNDVINTLDDLFTEIKDCESSARGYVATKNDFFLDDYYKAPQLADSILNLLHSQVKDNASQLQRLDTLREFDK